MIRLFPLTFALLLLASSATIASAQMNAKLDSYRNLFVNYPISYPLRYLIQKHTHCTEDLARNIVVIVSRCEPDRRVPGYFMGPTVKSIRASSPAVTYDFTVNTHGKVDHYTDVFDYAPWR